MSKKKVLIVDYAKWDSLMEIPYLFFLAGVSVDSYSLKDSWLSKSKYLNEVFYSSEEVDVYLNNLSSLIGKEEYDWVVLGDDIVIRMIAQNISKYKSFEKLIPIRNFQNLNVLGSKAGLLKACNDGGILTPPSVLCNISDDINLLTEKVTFPLLIKVDESSGGAGVYYCKNIDDVKINLNKLNENEKINVVLQKYIRGKNISVEAIFKEGDLIMYSYSEVVKTLDGEFGISAERFYRNCEEIEKNLKDVGIFFGINGFCSMTFMCENGVYYLIEADLRPQGWFVLSRLAGIDFSLGIIEFLSQNSGLINQKILNNKSEIIIRNYIRCLSFSIKNKQYKLLFSLIFNLNNDWRTLPFHDLKLLLSIIKQRIKGLFGKYMPD